MKAKRGRDDNFIQKNVAMAGAEETAIPQNGNEVLLNADPEERVTEVISKFQSDPKRRRTRKRKGKLIVLSEGDQDDHSLSLVQQVNAIEGISVEFPEEDNDDDPAAQGKKRKRQASTGDFTDDKFYISHYKADRHTEEGFSMAGNGNTSTAYSTFNRNLYPFQGIPWICKVMMRAVYTRKSSRPSGTESA